MKNVTRRQWLQQTVGATIAAGMQNYLPGSAFSAEKAAKPNIVILYVDDLGWGDLGCYGAKDIPTPNIDLLAASGVRFNCWYSNSPICAPSRASLHTGRYPQRAGVPTNTGAGRNTPGMPPEEFTLAEVLKTLGYRTGLCGKWHLGSSEACRPNHQGFDEFYGFLSGCVDYYSHIFYWGQSGDKVPYHDLWRNREEIWENGCYLTQRIAEEAMSFIQSHRAEAFFLCAAFNAPHYPMHAPRTAWERVKHIFDPQRRMQAAMIVELDDAVGRILLKIQNCGLAEKTIIFFQSDNGPSCETRNLLEDSGQPYHGGSAGSFRGYKGGLFEGGIRVPAIWSYPGTFPKGMVIDQPAMTMDVYPTLLQLTGGQVPENLKLDGKDIRPMILNQEQSPHEALFWGLDQQRAVRRGNWKLILNGKSDFQNALPDAVFLCNLAEDPGETVNWASNYPDHVKTLTALIHAWEKDVGI